MPSRKQPWDQWVPGVLRPEQIKELWKQNLIKLTGEPSQEDPSAFDLHLGSEGWELLQGSVKPSGRPYAEELQSSKIATSLRSGSNGSFHLKKEHVYVFRVKEALQFPADAKFYGQATARSSVGRCDVLARLIVDGADGYEAFEPPRSDGTRQMYLEVTPMSFEVLVKPDTSLSQLRLFYGKPEHSELGADAIAEATIKLAAAEPDEYLRVDLTEAEIHGESGVAFQSRGDENQAPVPLFDAPSKPRREDYWTLKPAEESHLIVAKGKFYILRSKERLTIPPGVAVYCRAIDETIGEMRIHYAGFAHPYFGLDREDGQTGTPLIFEVRGHGPSVVLRDGEKMARLIFYRMSKEPDRPKQNSYSGQSLTLSKFFQE